LRLRGATRGAVGPLRRRALVVGAGCDLTRARGAVGGGDALGWWRVDRGIGQRRRCILLRIDHDSCWPAADAGDARLSRRAAFVRRARRSGPWLRRVARAHNRQHCARQSAAKRCKSTRNETRYSHAGSLAEVVQCVCRDDPESTARRRRSGLG
jgi:hypothetical protein